MKRAAFLWSVYAGGISAIIYGLVQQFSIMAGLQANTVWGAAGGIFLPLEQIATPLGTVIGWVAHILVGAVWGVGFYVFLLFFGMERSIYKGICVGLFAWLFGTLMMRWGVTTYTNFVATEQVWTLIDTVVFGASLGYLVPRMAMKGAAKPYSISSRLQEKRLAQPVYKPTPAVEEQSKNDRDDQ